MTDVLNIFKKKRCPFKMNTYHETRQQPEYSGTVFLAKFTHKQQQPLTWSESQGYTISWAHRPTTSSVFASEFLNEILMHSKKVKYCYNQWPSNDDYVVSTFCITSYYKHNNTKYSRTSSPLHSP